MMEIFLAGSDPVLPRRYGKIKLVVTRTRTVWNLLLDFIADLVLLEISLSFFTLKDSEIDRGHFFDVQDYI